MTRWLDDDQERAWRGLRTMTNRLNARLNRQLQDGSGLSHPDYEVLVRLTDVPDGQLRVFELAEDLQWEQSRLSHQLARMQRRGLIARQNCATDRRGAFVQLTEQGREAIEQAAPGHVETVRDLVFDGLTAEQVAALQTITEAVLARLAG